ncbi:MAG: Na+/H+ antiporter subunit E [Firmicutes bacterium]|nr:Na+/H+ antiporter subunit E [Bacillota bacterium]
MSFWLTAILMFSFWILLSGEFDLLLLLLGVISSLLVAYWSHDLLIDRFDFRVFLEKTWRFLKYLPWLLWQIVLANIELVYLTLHPKMPIEPEIITFNPDLKTDFGIISLANSITLTPGTVTIVASKDEFIVHAITKSAAESLISGEMQARVKEVEGKDV